MLNGILEFVILKHYDDVNIYAFDVTNQHNIPTEKTNIHRLVHEGRQTFYHYAELRASPCKFSDAKQVVFDFYYTKHKEYKLSRVLLCDIIKRTIYSANDLNSDFIKICDCSDSAVL